MKRLFDIFASLSGLLVAAPVLIVIAILVKLTSRGPVLYRSERVGLQGRKFQLLKFRSMVVDADRKGALNVGHTDPRVTRLGRFLRTSKLDELPQLFNVLKGDMAVVGPRPDLPYYVAMYSDEEREAILGLRPGLTDWASLVNAQQYAAFSAADDADEFFLKEIRPLKCCLQMHYVRTRSLGTDLRILVWTPIKMLTRTTRLPADIERVVAEHRLHSASPAEVLEDAAEMT